MTIGPSVERPELEPTDINQVSVDDEENKKAEIKESYDDQDFKEAVDRAATRISELQGLTAEEQDRVDSFLKYWKQLAEVGASAEETKNLNRDGLIKLVQKYYDQYEDLLDSAKKYYDNATEERKDREFKYKVHEALVKSF